MTTFDGFISTLKTFLLGFFPVGGTMVPVSDTFPVVMAQHVMGGFAPYPDNQSLAGIPYQNLQIDMEVIVSAHNDGVNNNPRTRWRLKAMPGTGLRVIDIPGYALTDYWEVVNIYDGGDPDVIPGPPGNKGWTPQLVNENDGASRVVERIIGYIGGEGTPPALPPPSSSYIGSLGFTTKSLAINKKGDPGPAGSNATSRPMYYGIDGSRRVIPPTTVWTDPQGYFKYVTSVLIVNNSFTSSRWFMVQGEVPVSNDSGNDSWVVMLLQRPNNVWPAESDQNAIKAQTRQDVNYSRTDFVNAAPFPAVHKIKVSTPIFLNPGETVYFRLVLTQTNGTNSFYNFGMIEVFGL
jgi:hypothetical protein